MTTTVPFSPIDEAVFEIEREYTPWNIQLEVESTTEIDAERLRAATRSACLAHPLARARRADHDAWDSGYVWEIPDTLDTVPLEVVSADDDHELAAIRSHFYGRSLDLTASPPFRLLLVRGDGGDRLLASVSHVPADGVGTLRLLRSICATYRGEVPGPDPVDLETARGVFDDLRPASPTGRVDLLGTAARKLRHTIDRPARIAEDGGTDGFEWGFVHRTVGPELTKRLVGGRPDGVSVNDVLLAALHLAIDAWNRDHGEQAGKISLMMPINLRPGEWFYEVVGMYALFESVTTEPSHRTDPAATVERVVEQTTAVKEEDRAVALLESLELIPDAAPVGLTGALPKLLDGPGRGLLDTAMLSNLGRVPEPLPRFDEQSEDPAGLWFSPPCWQPTPVSIGVVTVGGTMRLGFRHAHTALDRDAAERFADGYFAALERTVETI